MDPYIIIGNIVFILLAILILPFWILILFISIGDVLRYRFEIYKYENQERQKEKNRQETIEILSSRIGEISIVYIIVDKYL